MPITNAQLSQIRKQTSGLQFVTHFNNAGSSLMPDPVLETVSRYLQDENRRGGYEQMASQAADLQQVYQDVASLVGAQADEIALVQSATIAWYKAFRSLDWKTGDVVLTAEAAYGSNYIGYLQLQKQLGIDIRVAPSTDEGIIDLKAMESLVDERVKLIAITHLPTHNGLVNPAAGVGEIARKYDIPYLLDACQAVGHMPLDVEAIGCDFLAATGRKYLRAPRGTGFLYVHPRMLDRVEVPFPDLTGANWVEEDRYEYVSGAKRFENFESSRALNLGLGHSAAYANALGMEHIWGRIKLISSKLREGLNSIPGIRVHDRGPIQSGIVTFSHTAKTADQIKAHLDTQRINVSIAWPGAALLDMQRNGLGRMVRASVHYFNTEEEVDKLLNAVEYAIKP